MIGTPVPTVPVNHNFEQLAAIVGSPQLDDAPAGDRSGSDVPDDSFGLCLVTGNRPDKIAAQHLRARRDWAEEPFT
jgi:hypothetical protein